VLVESQQRWLNRFIKACATIQHDFGQGAVVAEIQKSVELHSTIRNDFSPPNL
jgi:hypothetical protein